jgi:hypothetical protein
VDEGRSLPAAPNEAKKPKAAKTKSKQAASFGRIHDTINTKLHRIDRQPTTHINININNYPQINRVGVSRIVV